MSTDNYLLITEGAVVYEGQGDGPCPYSSQRPLVTCKSIAAAILFCENYRRQEIVEYGYSLTQEAQEELRKETGDTVSPKMDRKTAREYILAQIENMWRDPNFSDIRFGQLMINLFSFYAPQDPWFLHDEDWPAVIEKFRGSI